MTRRACIISTCAAVAVAGSSRCPSHSRGWVKSPQMQARSSLYGRAWRKRRDAQLAEFPYCAWCGAPANIADHIFPIGLGGDPGGPLQSLCRPCHAKKTASEGGRAAKARRNR